MVDKKHIFCEIIDADLTGVTPDDYHFDDHGQTVLDLIIESEDKVGILTPCICMLVYLKGSLMFVHVAS